MKRGYADARHGQLHYRRSGEGGRPLILLHQAPSSSVMWVELLEPLARRGFDAIAFDLPGLGLSDPWPTDPEVEDYADAIAEGARALGLERYDAFGHHTGCTVAMVMSVRHAPAVERVIGWGIPLVSERHMHQLATEEPPTYDAEGTEILKSWTEFQRYARPSSLPWTALRLLVDSMTIEERRPLAHRAVGRSDQQAICAAMAVPMLVLAGTREMLRTETEAAAELSEHITFRELGDCGMFVGDEEPELLADVIAEFLAR